MRLKEKAEALVAKAHEFERRPPIWAYWVFGIAFYLAIQCVRFL